MTLPPSQQHALDAIDGNLQTAEPMPATMFGVFTDLTRQEAMPAAETLPPESWWTWHPLPGRRPGPRRPSAGRSGPGRRLGRLVLVPLLLIAALSVVVVSLAGSGAAGRRGCGQAVAVVGSTGRSTGPHLHFEVLKDGRQIDPMAFVGH